MVRVLQGIEPTKVFRYFEDISNIPRASGYEKQISDYLVCWAKKHDLKVIQDEKLNVIIRKEGTEGYKDSPGVILQGHMDMVCEKNSKINHNFGKDPLKLRVIGDMIYATGTTLGGDDGVAIAIGLAILASEDIPHPPIELLITSSEETGMSGALALNPENVKGKALINIDSEEEGVLLASCAGGCSARVSIPINWDISNKSDKVFLLKIKGLKGGHSGSEIHKGRGNANKIMARVLKDLKDNLDFKICKITGGSKHNVIASHSEASIVMCAKYEFDMKSRVISLQKILKDEFKSSDSDLKIEIENVELWPEKVMSYNTTENVINFMYLIPDGVQSMSKDMEGIVESSLNLAVVATGDNSVECLSSIRSSVRSLRDNIFNIIVTIGHFVNVKVEIESSYPEWKYRNDSNIRKIMIKTYKILFGKEPIVSAIHAGLECGIFAEKFNNQLDMISIGPDVLDIHTPNEHLSISSMQRTWIYLLEVLKELK